MGQSKALGFVGPFSLSEIERCDVAATSIAALRLLPLAFPEEGIEVGYSRQ